MIRKLTCIECPKSCQLSIDIENGRVVRVSGNQCPKGEEYARLEVENPTRILTGTILAQGLSLKMVPVKTDKPIPKAKIVEAALFLRTIKVSKPVAIGDVISRNFLELGVDLVVTRSVS